MFKNKRYLYIFLALLTIGFAIVSYIRGMGADLAGDYHIYWVGGNNFLKGTKIYTPGLLDSGFNYPPFAAMCYSIFAVCPFYISAVIYSFVVNYGLWLASLVLVRRIFTLFFPKENVDLPVILAALVSIGFYWHNYIYMNANLPVLCGTLLGIQYYITKRFNLSYLFFIIGAFLKITPIIFLFFIAIKRGPKEWPKMILMALPFILIPMVLRGFSTGIQDWADYYQAFVAPFSKGQVDHIAISTGIPSMLNKFNLGNVGLGIPSLFNWSQHTLKTVVLVIQISVFVAVLAKFLYDKYVKKNEEFSPADFCLLFLLTLLLPGRVWAHHHVCVSFIYTYVFIFTRKNKVLFGIAIFLTLLLNIINVDILGQYLSDLLMHITTSTWVMLFCTVIIIKYGYLGKEKINSKDLRSF